MASKLRVTFTGLCLFARDDQEGCLHVLMPTMPRHGCGHMPPHQATAYVHKDHRPGVPDHGDHFAYPLDGLTLDLRIFGGVGQPIPKVPSEIFDIHQAVGARVIRGVIDDPTHIRTRVTLAGGRFEYPGKGGWWKFAQGDCGPAADVKMAHYVEWVIDIASNELIWPFGRIGTGHYRGALRPDSSSGEVVIHVIHAETPHPSTIPDTTIPQTPQGPAPTHFPAFYRLVRANCTPDPIFSRPMDLPAQSAANKHTPPMISNNYTCMGTQAPVG